MGQDPERHRTDVQMAVSPGAHTAYGIGELKIKTERYQGALLRVAKIPGE